MMYKRILTIGLAAIMAVGTSVPAWASVCSACGAAAGNYPAEPTAIIICQDSPTMLTDEQLSAAIDTAPGILETRSSATMINRRMTEAELTAWSEEFWELGGINAFELEVVRLINIERAAEGLHPLALNPVLSMAARFHSQEMADLQYFTHASPIYGRGRDRAKMFGHTNEQAGFFGAHENIHGGALTPARAIQGWMDSPSHRRAVLDPDARTVGVGAVRISEYGSGRTTAKFGF